MSEVQATQTSYEHVNRFPFIETENPLDHHVPAIQHTLKELKKVRKPCLLTSRR